MTILLIIPSSTDGRVCLGTTAMVETFVLMAMIWRRRTRLVCWALSCKSRLRKLFLPFREPTLYVTGAGDPPLWSHVGHLILELFSQNIDVFGLAPPLIAPQISLQISRWLWSQPLPSPAYIEGTPLFVACRLFVLKIHGASVNDIPPARVWLLASAGFKLSSSKYLLLIPVTLHLWSHSASVTCLWFGRKRG